MNNLDFPCWLCGLKLRDRDRGLRSKAAGKVLASSRGEPKISCLKLSELIFVQSLPDSVCSAAGGKKGKAWTFT